MNTPTILRHYAGYNVWANRRFVDRLSSEGEGILDREAPGSFPSLRLTLLHMRDAENAWLCRLKGRAFNWPAEPSIEIATLLPYSQLLYDQVHSMDDDACIHEVVYKDLKGNDYRQPAWQLLMHCFNHGTQHRAQLITMMRALGAKEIPANDMVVFQRQSMALL